jgi:hypothetical protein
MPAIPPKYRRWLYAVGIALVPVLVGFGWLEDSLAPAVIGLVYAVFMGGMAVANVKPEAAQPEPEDAAE